LTYKELKANGFTNITTFELMKRDWMIDELRARPVDRMIAHTGFLTVAKKAWRLPPAASVSDDVQESDQPSATDSQSQP
jgi:tRNA (adenine57-N1/adenine58-N1)-methyltransferase